MEPEFHAKKLSSNINKNYIFLGLNTLDLTRGLWMIYLFTRGFSLIELGILEGVFHLTTFIMEIPTGIVADLWGRRLSRLLGRIIFLTSLGIMFWSYSFSLQLIGFIITAIGYNLESGAGEALLYDSMKELGIEEQYKKTAGYNNLIFEIGGIVSFLMGGYLAVHMGYTWVFIPSMIIVLFSILLTFSMHEPSITKHEQTRLKNMGWFKAMGVQTRESFQVIKDRPKIAFLILFSELIFMFLTSLFYYLQTFWKGNGWNEFQIGLVLAATAVLSAFSGVKGGSIEKKIGEKGILLFAPLLLLVSLWGIALTTFAPYFFIITGLIDGLLYVAVQDYINKLIPSERRATVLSFQSMTFSLYMIIFFPAIGFFGDRFGLEYSFVGLAVIGTVMYGFYLLFTRKIFKP
ncbi:MAG: MFS transporter [Spirochaetales bacterium]|nr:MFS transporter [Spirochaetales bacterium]